MEKAICRLCERHKARICDKLRDAGVCVIAIDAVRKHFDYLKEDLLKEMQGDQENGTTKKVLCKYENKNNSRKE